MRGEGWRGESVLGCRLHYWVGHRAKQSGELWRVIGCVLSRCGWDPQQTVPVATLAPTYDVGQDAGMRFLLPVGRSGWAIAAGYAGLFAFVFFPAPLAIILGIIAIRDLKKHPEKHGMGRAIFGLVTGCLGTVALIMGIIAINLSGRH